MPALNIGVHALIIKMPALTVSSYQLYSELISISQSELSDIDSFAIRRSLDDNHGIIRLHDTEVLEMLAFLDRPIPSQS